MTITVFAQTKVTGIVDDKSDKNPLMGVTVIVNDSAGFATDLDGFFEFETRSTELKITFSYIGYETEVLNYSVKKGGENKIEISLNPTSEIISEVVVSAGKYRQRLSDLTISAVVLKPAAIMDQNISSIEAAINKTPGVDVTDDQPSIRGGSGYSYGAGSRVLIMMDDMPIMSGDAADPKWDYIPTESIGQVEILKGASSVLYGSSALNGVINFRTEQPTSTPKTRLDVFGGAYMNPARKELIWYGNKQPYLYGASISHSRKIKNFDILAGGNLFNDTGYRENSYEQRGRGSLKFKWNSKKIKGLSAGVNANAMYADKADFFLWQDADSGAYKQNLDALAKMIGVRFNADPFIHYSGPRGITHKLNTRYFRIENGFKDDEAKNALSEVYFTEYQFQKAIKGDTENGIVSAGLTSSYSKVLANLYGEHHSNNTAFYGQIDRKIKKLSFSAGFRMEYFRTDTTETTSRVGSYQIPFHPVVRAGVSYAAGKYTFIRASYGQGYRFPSIAEKYVQTNLSSLRIFPNANLEPETGWNSEIGVKQGIKVLGMKGFIDVAAFYTRYMNMMEFAFGIYKPDSALYPTLNDVGFKSVNVGEAKIYGTDIMLVLEGKIGPCPVSIMAGYTYTNPIDMSDTIGSDTSKVLKYRYYHTTKGGFEVGYKKVRLNLSYSYRSFMLHIDKALEEPLIAGYDDSRILPGLKEYRLENNKGYTVIDMSLSYAVSEHSTVSLLINNLLNKEYMVRPADIGPPRQVSLRYSLKF